ncbi:unnamed protein product, partial [Durusdinium trenchii]
HDDCDAFFGQLTKVIGSCFFSTPADVADVINNVWEGGRQSKRFETLGLCAKANRLDLAKDWKKWLCDLGIVMKGL